MSSCHAIVITVTAVNQARNGGQAERPAIPVLLVIHAEGKWRKWFRFALLNCGAKPVSVVSES